MKKQMNTAAAATSRQLTPLESQNLQRLRINRAVLTQELRVEHVLHSLAERGVLSDDDCDFIAQGRSQREQTRRLLDLLPTKGRKADWYRHFRDALRSPDTASGEERHQCHMLAEFLDSTLIGRLGRDALLTAAPAAAAAIAAADASSSAASVAAASMPSDAGPRLAALPAIGRQQRQDGRPKGDGVNRPGHPAAASRNEPRASAAAAAAATAAPADSAPVADAEAAASATSQSRGGQPEVLIRDRERHAAVEQAVFTTMREAEAAHARAWSSGQLSPAVAGAEGEGRSLALLRADGVIRMLLDAENRHVYSKYLVALRTVKSTDILTSVAALHPALCELVLAGSDAADERLEFVSKASLGLAALLQDLGSFNDAAAVLATAAARLRAVGRRSAPGRADGDGAASPGGGLGGRSAAGSGGRDAVILAWRLLYEVQVGTVGLLLRRGDFTGASEAGSRAAALSAKLELVSFGKRGVDGTRLALHMHALLHDGGHVAAANEWLRKAVQELDQSDHEAVVRVLCTTSQAYAFRGSLSRAETLVTHAVRLARTTFGILHPLYVRALLHYVLFSNDMRQDDSGFATAQRLVALGERAYGPNTVQAAILHRAAAAASLAADRADDGAAACRHARRSLITLQTALKGQTTPASASFHEVLGQSLLRRAATVQDAAERAACLEEAELELAAALDESEHWYGSGSYQAAMSCYTLGQLMAQLKDYASGVRYYERAVETLCKCSLPVGNSAVHVVRAALGGLHATAGRFQEAVELLERATSAYHTQGYPLKWYAAAYQSLAACRRALGDADGARETEARLVAWSWDAEDHVASRRQALEDEPAQDLTSLFGEINLWRAQYTKVLAGLRSGSNADDADGDGSSPHAAAIVAD